MIHEVAITDKMVSWARKIADEQGSINGSFEDGKGNLAGYIGEAAVMVYCRDCGIDCKRIGDYKFDLLITGVRYEVKTKQRTVDFVDLSWPASIAASSEHQNPDMYVFCTLFNQEKAFITGEIEREEFYALAHFVKKGEVDPSNNWTAKADHYSVAYNKLRGFG